MLLFLSSALFSQSLISGPGSIDYNEPYVVINPTDDNYMIAAAHYRKFNGCADSDNKVATIITTDGGLNWQEQQLNPNSNYYTKYADPVLTYDSQGSAYFCFLGSWTESNPSWSGIITLKSTNNGSTWIEQNEIIRKNFTNEGIAFDKPFIHSDKSNSSLYKDRTYVTFLSIKFFWH